MKYEKISGHVVYYGSIIAITVLCIVIPFDYAAGFKQLALFELLTVFILIGCILYYRIYRNYNLVSSVIITVLFSLLTYALYVNFTYVSLNWYFVLPITASFLLGFKRSFILNILFFSVFLWLALRLRGEVSDTKILFIMVEFLLIQSVSLLHEYTRHLVIEEAKRLSITDPLTGVYNRRFFESELRSQIQISRRTKNPLSLVIFDVDHFKKINDSFGHKMGDRALIELTEVFKENFRLHDKLFRIGGEEFAVLIDADHERSGQMMRRFMQLLADHDFVNGRQFTISAGIAVFGDSDDEETIMKRADSNMYTAKKKGRNNIVADG